MLKVYVGPMFAGKTESLFREAGLAHIAGQKILVVKSEVDTRNPRRDIIYSHDQRGLIVDTVVAGETVWLAEADIYIFDEVQFLSQAWIDYIDFLAKRHEVICTCLSQDYRGKPFGMAPQLLAIADKIVSLRAICMDCRKKDSATKTFRISKEGDQVEVGGVDKYKSLCRDCWEKAWR